MSIHRERVLRLFKDINIDSLLLSLAQSRFPMRFTLCCSWSQKLWKCMRRNHVLAEYFLSFRFFLLFFVVRRRFIFIRWNASHKLLYTVTNKGFKTNVSWYIFFFWHKCSCFCQFCVHCLYFMFVEISFKHHSQLCMLKFHLEENFLSPCIHAFPFSQRLYLCYWVTLLFIPVALSWWLEF